MYSYQSNAYNCSQPEKFPYGKSEKWAELTYYLNKPEVRDKIFDLFRKESLNLWFFYRIARQSIKLMKLTKPHKSQLKNKLNKKNSKPITY